MASIRSCAERGIASKWAGLPASAAFTAAPGAHGAVVPARPRASPVPRGTASCRTVSVSACPVPSASAAQHNLQTARLNSRTVSLPERSGAVLPQKSRLPQGRRLGSWPQTAFGKVPGVLRLTSKTAIDFFVILYASLRCAPLNYTGTALQSLPSYGPAGLGAHGRGGLT